VLPAAQYKAAEATARLVLDAARNDRDKIAIVARRIQGGTQISEGIASLVGSRPGSSQLTGRQPDARSDHRPWQPLGNHRPHRTQ
jgi:hypothetical protein